MGSLVGHLGDKRPDFSFGNTRKSLVGIDTARWTIRASRFGSHDGIETGKFVLSDALTGWINREHGFVTLSGSLPKHYGLSGGTTLGIDETASACLLAVAEAEEAGWFVPSGAPPWGGRFKRLDVTWDLPCEDRGAALEAAWPLLRFTAAEVPVRYGRPTETIAVHARNRRTGRTGRVGHRVYDKDRELGERVDLLRLEVQLSAYRLDKAGARDLTGDLHGAVGEGWAVLEKHGWWEALGA